MTDTKHRLCRVCLQCSEKCVSLYEQMGQLQVYEHIMSIAMVTIVPEDGHPNSICSACLLQLQEAINFKKKCEDSDCFLSGSTGSQNRNIYISSSPQPNNEEIAAKIKQEDEVLIDSSTTEYLEPLYNDEYDIERALNIPTPAKGQLFSPQCNECKQYFRSKCKLRVHWKKEHLKGELLCIICKRIFKTRSAFQNHKSNGPRSCTELLQHSENVVVVGLGKSRVYQCKHCDYKASHYKEMQQHFVVHRPGDKPFKCELCPSAYTQIGSLNSHTMEQHDRTKKLTCHVCGKVELSMRKFTRHMRIHREASFPCPTCGKLFKTNDTKKQHMRRHTGEKTYSCEACSKTFYTSAELSNHRRTQHKSNFKCNMCEFQNKGQIYMNKHEVQHAGDKSVPCIKCGKFYKTVHDLQVHLSKFHNPKHFECPLCHKTYSNKNSTAWHMAKKHGCKPPYNIKNPTSLGKPLHVARLESTAEPIEDS